MNQYSEIKPDIKQQLDQWHDLIRECRHLAVTENMEDRPFFASVGRAVIASYDVRMKPAKEVRLYALVRPFFNESTYSRSKSVSERDPANPRVHLIRAIELPPGSSMAILKALDKEIEHYGYKSPFGELKRKVLNLANELPIVVQKHFDIEGQNLDSASLERVLD